LQDRAEAGRGIVAQPFARTTTRGRRRDGLRGDGGEAGGGGGDGAAAAVAVIAQAAAAVDGAGADAGGDLCSVCRRAQTQANSPR